MSNYIRITKNPETGYMEEAIWTDHPDGYYVTFPDGTTYEKAHKREWEFSETKIYPDKELQSMHK